MLNDLLVVTISMFAIVDPFTSIPVFVSFFGNSAKKKQRRAAIETSGAAFILLVIFSLAGLSLLTYINVSISAFMIAGGLLLLYLAFEFLKGELPKTRTVDASPGDAIVPIGTPLLAGPGAITSAIFFTHVYGIWITLAGISIVIALSALLLVSSSRINKVVGRNGLKVLTRIMGLITAAIAISLIEKALIAYRLIAA
jgi:multiple antibiotic resistance protein